MHLLIVGKSRADRLRYAPQSSTERLSAALLPFRLPVASAVTPRLIRIDDVDLGFPNAQTTGTRLILTQSTYLLQKWLDALQPQDRMLLTADRLALTTVAREALEGRGPWRRFQLVDLDSEAASSNEDPAALPVAPEPTETERLLVSAFESPSPEGRLALCRRAAQSNPASPVTELALASACRECQAVDSARTALDRALSIAPSWEAAHYEDGKFWLACEDLERARAAFERACEAMPTFTAAWSNLGATLGELDQPEAALTAFQHALTTDPDSFMVLNNIGVVARELGRSDESEAALTRVNQLAPEFVFGYYNLGHTRLLAGRLDDSLAAYEEGWRRDPQKNRRQGCRLAVVRLLRGAGRSCELFWELANHAPRDEREDLLLEAFEIIRTFAAQPSTAQAAFLDEIAATLRSFADR